MTDELVNILKIIYIIQKSIYILLFVIIGLGAISLISNIVRVAIIRIVVSMILVVSAMITNLVSKFLTIDLVIYHVNTNTLTPAIILLAMQVLIAILLMILIFKKKK